jgi:hypothetical protein
MIHDVPEAPARWTIEPARAGPRFHRAGGNRRREANSLTKIAKGLEVPSHPQEG